MVVTLVGSCLLQHQSHLLVHYFSSVRWGPCGLFAVTVWIPLMRCISSWLIQQLYWDNIVSMDIRLLICSQYMNFIGVQCISSWFMQQMSCDIIVWKPSCRLDNGGIEILFPAGHKIFLCCRTFRLFLGSTQLPVPWWVGVAFLLRVNQLTNESDYWPLSSAEVKNEKMCMAVLQNRGSICCQPVHY